MNVVAVKLAADVNPEPQSLPASSAGECPPIERMLLPDPAHLTVRVPMDAQGPAGAIVTTVVVVFTLQRAEKFFIPLLLGIIIACTIHPLVVWQERIKIPRVVGTSIVLLVVLCGGEFVTISLRGQIQTILAQLPEAESKLSVALLSMREGQPTSMQKVQAAAREIDKATSQAADIHAPGTPDLDRVPLDRVGQCRSMGDRCRCSSRHSLLGTRTDRGRGGHGGLHAI
ncbi:MAG TPA: hypothetical protein VIR02_05325 [Anaerolineales bacterium]